MLSGALYYCLNDGSGIYPLDDDTFLIKERKFPNNHLEITVFVSRKQN